ncbi:MAG: bifunctional UDP-N-acetylglucosamine diphosphorylase/glucosamine-1-phosphate N-acetyltransferase GlmU [Anaerolineales bacterium]|nr:bifunctional UDP-N-acetylglucosamine diphosphorylase/glucosamine-1-phosphate N-acetyltransferase GlmU [Anaerolineales bacterium]MCX7755421.1 bifunctional UDP-N-acetylglucosamine diphosphorylase/glucosamine-1-phosphate N-acetyltransferase GlmU [Anaerolineales bacterium]MDW8279012.1 bifunctional UDP-N-acetylglucosamine diphosphorylase/glucosamine-1-phosphate N-acetyltransferase GlmU [Anaerolineales bacterium]
MTRITAVLLAAGQGTRMKSNLPKVLHPVCGRPMVLHALEAARAASTETPVLVVGVGADEVRSRLGENVRYAVQERQLGTAHAVMQAEALLKGQSDYVLVTYADMPLLRAETLRRLVETQQANRGPMTMLTVVYEDPRGFGRVLRKPDGTVSAIVEEYVATPEQLAVKELNVGAYCFRADWLWDALHRIPMSPKGEYYLTDTVELAVRDGLPVQAIVLDDLTETIGVNTRVHLAEAEAAMRRRINEMHMLNGVTLIDPDTTYIEAGVTIGADTVIWPNTYIQGQTSIGHGCSIGPNTHIRASKIGDRCTVFFSVMEGAWLENDVEMGPFARLRKGAHLCDHVHMGNFGEVKDSTLGPGVKMGHFSYIGNAQIGPNVNIGAGTITCNYDGEKKHPTEIGEGAFIGSDTMLVAPVRVGEYARTGAGAVVTKDIPPDSLAVGVPARVIRTLQRNNRDE